MTLEKLCFRHDFDTSGLLRSRFLYGLQPVRIVLERSGLDGAKTCRASPNIRLPPCVPSERPHDNLNPQLRAAHFLQKLQSMPTQGPRFETLLRRLKLSDRLTLGFLGSSTRMNAQKRDPALKAFYGGFKKLNFGSLSGLQYGTVH